MWKISTLPLPLLKGNILTNRYKVLFQLTSEWLLSHWSVWESYKIDLFLPWNVIDDDKWVTYDNIRWRWAGANDGQVDNRYNNNMAMSGLTIGEAKNLMMSCSPTAKFLFRKCFGSSQGSNCAEIASFGHTLLKWRARSLESLTGHPTYNPNNGFLFTRLCICIKPCSCKSKWLILLYYFILC